LAPEAPLAPAQRYTVRRFEPADAVGVAQSIYRAFGYTYADADIYYPARIIHLNETGQALRSTRAPMLWPISVSSSTGRG
jgi:hypothetical protein